MFGLNPDHLHLVPSAAFPSEAHRTWTRAAEVHPCPSPLDASMVRPFGLARAIGAVEVDAVPTGFFFLPPEARDRDRAIFGDRSKPTSTRVDAAASPRELEEPRGCLLLHAPLACDASSRSPSGSLAIAKPTRAACRQPGLTPLDRAPWDPRSFAFSRCFRSKAHGARAFAPPFAPSITASPPSREACTFRSVGFISRTGGRHGAGRFSSSSDGGGDPAPTFPGRSGALVLLAVSSCSAGGTRSRGSTPRRPTALRDVALEARLGAASQRETAGLAPTYSTGGAR